MGITSSLWGIGLLKGSNSNLSSSSIVKRLAFLVQYLLVTLVSDGLTFGVVQKAVHEIAEVLTRLAEEILVVVGVCFVGAAGVEVLCHDI